MPAVLHSTAPAAHPPREGTGPPAQLEEEGKGADVAGVGGRRDASHVPQWHLSNAPYVWSPCQATFRCLSNCDWVAVGYARRAWSARNDLVWRQGGGRGSVDSRKAPNRLELAGAVELSPPRSRSLVCEPASLSSRPSGWPWSAGTKTRHRGDLWCARVTVSAPSRARTSRSWRVRRSRRHSRRGKTSIARIGFAGVDEDIDAGWVLAYMYDG